MTDRRAGAILAGVFVAAIALLGVPAPWPDGAAAARPGARALTASQLSRGLAAAARARRVPGRLDPPLDEAAAALPIINRNGCHAHRAGVGSRLCIYGDTTSETAVVLFGDSHAAAWFPALNLIARQRHWRLVVMTKPGCPPAEVRIVHGANSYRTCPLWRANMQIQIAALHPALVIVAAATYHEAPAAAPLSGVPTGNGSAWLNGWAAMFSFLHGAASHVLFISDVPTLRVRAPACASRHRSDLRRCNTKRSAAIRLPAVKAREIELARREGVQVIDPISYFCARTSCPVIAEHIVLFRDRAHMTPPWSRFIAPVLGAAIGPILPGEARRRTASSATTNLIA